MPILIQLLCAQQPSGNDPVGNAKSTLLKILESQLEASKLRVAGKSSTLTERQKWFNRSDDAGETSCLDNTTSIPFSDTVIWAVLAPPIT